LGDQRVVLGTRIVVRATSITWLMVMLVSV
jgi:hypothetical protein